MILSSDRQNHLVHLLFKELKKGGFVSYEDEDKALSVFRKSFNQCMKECQNMDEKARAKIASLKRNVMEQSSEWMVLYNNYLEDEMIRRGLSPLKDGPFRS